MANAGYITENQPITISGDAAGSGTTAITLELSDTGVTPGAYTNSNITVDIDGRVTAAASGTSTNQTITLSGDLYRQWYDGDQCADCGECGWHGGDCEQQCDVCKNTEHDGGAALGNPTGGAAAPVK